MCAHPFLYLLYYVISMLSIHLTTSMRCHVKRPQEFLGVWRNCRRQFRQTPKNSCEPRSGEVYDQRSSPAVSIFMGELDKQRPPERDYLKSRSGGLWPMQHQYLTRFSHRQVSPRWRVSHRQVSPKAEYSRDDPCGHHARHTSHSAYACASFRSRSAFR